MTNTEIAAIWCRISTVGQGELSPESQEDRVRQVLEAKGFEVPSHYVFKVEWSSLDLESCPEFQQLRRLIVEGKVQAVGTFDRDRLQAQGLQRLVFLSECKERGIELITAQGAPMLEGGEGQLLELALALGKERSVARAQQGSRDGLRDRARLKGLPPTTNRFFGYQWDQQAQRYLPDQRYMEAYELWQLGLSGTPISAIARELTRRGILTPSGEQGWSAYSVRHILKNRSYAGVIEALKTEAVEPKKRRANTYGKSGRRSRPENERILLQGLVDRPIVTDAEYQWMQKRLQRNQQFARKNTRLRSYLLSGLIRCASCGRAYVGSTIQRRGKVYSYYGCGARWNKNPNVDSCSSRSLRADTVEAEVFGMVEQFLKGPEGFENEMRHRQGFSDKSEASLRRELASFDRQHSEELSAEARAFRLAAHGEVSEQVFEQETGLIRTKLQWIIEQRDRVLAQLADLERYRFDPVSVELLRKRLDTRLSSATEEDRRFILEAIGTKVIVQTDQSWELELQVPREVPEHVDNALQIANSRPESNSTGSEYHVWRAQPCAEWLARNAVRDAKKPSARGSYGLRRWSVRTRGTGHNRYPILTYRSLLLYSLPQRSTPR